MSLSPLLKTLVASLQVLPGVGPKSAQRMAFHLLQHDRDGAKRIAQSLESCMTEIDHCESCRNFSDTGLCEICQSTHRDAHLLCIVESPADVAAIEATRGFHGVYFVLFGRLSPIDGLGPEDIGLDILETRFKSGEITEVLLATNPTVEGEATAYYIADLARKYQIATTRIAHGIPMGGELGHVDESTLVRAILDRSPVS